MEVLTSPVTAASLLTGPTGIVDGFVVSANGLVLTSIHAIQGAATLRIATADGHSYPATIVRADPTHGVVLLQAVGAQHLTAAHLRDGHAQRRRPRHRRRPHARSRR